MIYLHRLLMVSFLLLLLSPALAAPKPTPLPEIQTIEDYLNGISTLQSRFTQTGGDGQQTTGSFMLKRPGRLRFEYDPPVKDFIVADGSFIFYYDEKMKQQSSVPISKSLADFFLRPDLRLSGDISVSDMQRKDGFLQVTLVQSREPLAGSLTLMFGENPLQLKKWQSVDAQGLTTTVELSESQVGIPLNNKLFHYYNPENNKSLINK